MHRPTMNIFALLLAGTLIVGCGETAAPGDAESPTAPRRARTLEVPGSGPPATTGQGESRGLVWEDPPGWQPTPPASSMRLAQYRVPGTDGAAECVVFYFGPRQGGDPQSNAIRWAGQFEQPDGGSSVERMTFGDLDGARVEVQIVEVTGTYDGGMTMTDAPAQKQPGWMLLGGIAKGPDAWWFFKLTGPEKTIRAQRDGFLGLMRSLHPAG